MVKDAAITFIVLAAFAVAWWSQGCERGQEATFAHGWKWSRAPITVATDLDFDWDDELALAIEQWNRAAGCDVFELAEGGDVFIVIGSPHPYLKGASWVTLRAGVPDRARIEIYGVAQTQVAYVVLLHELGRVLGLADDETQRHSAMHRNVAEVDPLDGPGVRITSRDGEAVRERYCAQ